jgi:hypothetical protein
MQSCLRQTKIIWPQYDFVTTLPDAEDYIHGEYLQFAVPEAH